MVRFYVVRRSDAGPTIHTTDIGVTASYRVALDTADRFNTRRQEHEVFYVEMDTKGWSRPRLLPPAATV
jgi:hypothetical protein